MPTNRDDFTPKTKDLAARRVGFLCSKPDCRCHTIGPSRESNRAVSNVGVAAHSCAAAPGGKRYDVNMTPEERMDIENCLWLCQTDAHLIDTDVETDAPFILPYCKDVIQPKFLRRARNTSLILPAVTKKIAELKGISADEVEKATTENTIRLFSLSIKRTEQ